MSGVFLDTSGLIAVVNTDDDLHQRASTLWSNLLKGGTPLLCSSWILVELGDGLSRLHHRDLALRIYNAIQSSRQIEVVPASADLERRAWQLFSERADKEWGITDCISMTIMADRGIQEVFSFDHHFQQAGLLPLLRSDP